MLLAQDPHDRVDVLVGRARHHQPQRFALAPVQQQADPPHREHPHLALELHDVVERDALVAEDQIAGLDPELPLLALVREAPRPAADRFLLVFRKADATE